MVLNFLLQNAKKTRSGLSDTDSLRVFESLPFDFFAENGGAILFSNTLSTLLEIPDPQSKTDLFNAFTPNSAAQLEAALNDQSHYTFSSTLKLVTRKTRYISARVTNFRIKNGPYSPLIWFYEDSETRLLEERLDQDAKNAKQLISQFTSSLDKLSSPVWLANSLSKVAWCNAAYAQLFSASKDQVLQNQSLPELTLLESSTQKINWATVLNDALKTKQTQAFIGRRIEGGKRFIYEVCLEPDDTNDLVICHLVDATEREELRRDLKRSDAAQSKLLENLRTAIGIFSANQKLTFYNQAFAELWGLEDVYLNSTPKLGEFLEKLRELRRLPEQSDFRAYKKMWLDWFTTLLQPHEEMLYLPNNNAVRLVAAPHPLGGVMLLFEDVTSNLALETSYNTLMAVQRETIDSLPEGVVVFGHDGRLRLWNNTISGMSLLPPEKLEAKPHISEWVSHFNQHFVGKPNEDIGLRIQGLVIEREETTLDIRRHKGDLLMTLTCNALPDGSVMLAMQDVTDRTRAEIALRERAEALKEAEQLKSDFLANVSYQFRTPLNAMTGFAEMLKLGVLGPMPDNQAGYIDHILEAGSHLSRLIDDILDLTSLEAGQMNLVIAPTDTDALLKNVKDIIRDWAGVKGIQFTCQRNGIDLPVLDTDEKRLKQVLITLLRQAIGRCQVGGKVTLLIEHSPQSALVLHISDTGQPISSDVLKRVFSPFETIGRMAEDGLGLSLSKNLIEAMSGTLSAEATPNGNIFTLHLPPRV